MNSAQMLLQWIFFERTVVQITIHYALDLITGNQFLQIQVDVYFAFSRASPF